MPPNKRKGRRFTDKPPTVPPVSAVPRRDGLCAIEPVNDFLEFIGGLLESKKYMGQNLDGEKMPYIPRDELVEYWTSRKLAAAFKSLAKEAKDPGREAELNCALVSSMKSIQTKYICVFSAILYINYRWIEILPSSIMPHRLDDSRFPIAKCPAEWISTPFHHEFVQMFQKKQWPFFPFQFSAETLLDSQLDSRHILPVVSHSMGLDQRRYADIRKLIVNGSYNSLEPEGEKSNTYVIKIFPKAYKSVFKNELNGLRQVICNRSGNIIRFFGAFGQGDRSAIILEYASGGDLEQYFKRTPPPTTPKDVFVFLRSLLGSLDGLAGVHNLPGGNQDRRVAGSGFFAGIHQDIKPENFVIEFLSDSPYDFTLKIVDFEKFCPVRVPTDSSIDMPVTDKHGSAIFSAPECYVPDESSSIRRVTTIPSDLFSMGAVLSHSLAWVVGGHGRQKQYRNDRAENQPPFIRNSGNEGCFHDGEKLLQCVVQFHEDICRDRASDDPIRIVVDIVEKMMVAEPKSRIGAQVALDLWNKRMARIQERPECGSQTRDSDDDTEQETQRSDSESEITIQQVLERMADDQLDPEINKLIEDLTRNVGGRDQCFFVDDSTSMRVYQDQVEKAVVSLEWIATFFKPKRIELSFASNPTQVFKSKTPKTRRRLIEALRKNPFEKSPAQMENGLAQLVDEVIAPRLKPRSAHSLVRLAEKLFSRRRPVSIYILTDGNWVGEPVNGLLPRPTVRNPINKLIEHLKSSNLNRNDVSLHFINFSDTESSRMVLSFLDDLGRPYWDIVDVKYFNSPVKQIFLGPTDQANDLTGEDPPDTQNSSPNWLSLQRSPCVRT